MGVATGNPITNIERLLSKRSLGVQASGIRRIFDLAASLKDPIDLSIGQPDFPTPAPMKQAAIRAIEEDRNGYTVTQGIRELNDRVRALVQDDVGWGADSDDVSAIISSGTLGALNLAFLALLDEGDEVIVPDPFFVAYPHLVELLGGKAVRCETYPDFRMNTERVEPLITSRTKAVLVNSPSNPAGVVLTRDECADLLNLCREKGVILISDEIYDEFTYEDAREPGLTRAPSPARLPDSLENVLLVRGFGKTYGCTGWRMGFAAGHQRLINEMAKCQQYTFVCSPSIAQWGCLESFACDPAETVRRFQKRRDLVVERLGEVTEVARPGGAFFVFPEVPERLGLTGQQFCEQAIAKSVLTIPSGVFSSRDTHFRISYAVAEEKLQQGLDILVDMMKS